MRSLSLVAGVVLAFGFSTANAADVAVSRNAPAAATVVAAPVYDWSGWYLGAHGGSGRSNFSGVFDTAGAAHQWSANNNDGAVWGAQIGVNIQTGMLVWGA